MSKTNILVVGDTHVGSLYGILPDKFIGSDDREVTLNPGQRHLWNCWDHLCGEVSKIKIDAIVHNGDMVDGHQRAQGGTELSLPIWADQTEAAIILMRKLLSAAGKPAFYQIQGTEYHDEKGGTAAEDVARALGATSYNGLGTGKYSRDCLDLDIDGVVLDFCHHIQGAGGLYRGTPTDREGVFSALAGKDGKAPKADAVFRSHLHYFVHTEHASKHIAIVPCWQLQTRFMRKLSRYKMIPDIGAILVTVDPEAKKNGEDPISIRKFLYPLPPVGTTKLRRVK